MKRISCENCGTEFLAYTKRRSCSRSCAVALAWKDPEKSAKRRASITAVRRRPESRAASTAANYWRWCQLGAREKMAEQSRQRWAKPRMRKKMSKAIRAAQGTPEQRAFYSEMRTAQWANNPEYRRKVVEGMRRHHTSPEARANFSILLTERWKDPEIRAKMVAANRRNANDPEVKAKLSARTRERWATDENFRATVLEACTIYQQSPEAYAVKSERMKALWGDPIWKMRQQQLIAGGMRVGTPLAAAAAAAALSTAVDLMEAVARALPPGLPDFAKADVSQDLLVSLLEGSLKLPDLRAAVKGHLTAYWKMHPTLFGPLSIDAPIPGTDGLTIADTLSNETPHF